ncbi:NTP transferase domain-containing protein [Actinocatenispora rupis]|uniref:MobA-like NTP transferase domain-containing protein n=1 Tax=Actinocatenispora rupis TaxID=519421 RepID=A0A8J3JB26_9ACTN|nr:NTP transferase domain-containing protein [Actinocatenispora rupis]GID13479.1 hypothetical protein Aru02nite_43680 [Actinocatenispora rupis]
MRELCAVVLAAGEGRRLRPLTELVPKPLCPVDGVPLLDRTLDRLAGLGLAGAAHVAVNACYLADAIVAHLDGRVHVSVEPPPALGTGGGVANLRDWIAGRDVLVCNADGYLAGGAPYAELLAGWAGDRPRLLVVPDATRGDFPSAGPRTLRFAGASLAPWPLVAALPTGASELNVPWRHADAAGRLDLVRYDGVFLDCGTPADYLAANLHASGGASVVGAGATVAGTLTRSVVWPGATVRAGEHLVDAVRAVAPDGSPVTVRAGRPAA